MYANPTLREHIRVRAARGEKAGELIRETARIEWDYIPNEFYALVREMKEEARRMDFEYAALLRDRLERLHRFRGELMAFRGAVEELSFVYRVPGFAGDDRLYLIRRGRIRRELTHPRSRHARERIAAAIDEVYGEPDPGPSALSPQDAAEIVLVARWFRLNPKERRRTVPPREWLKESQPA